MLAYCYSKNCLFLSLSDRHLYLDEKPSQSTQPFQNCLWFQANDLSQLIHSVRSVLISWISQKTLLEPSGAADSPYTTLEWLDPPGACNTTHCLSFCSTIAGFLQCSLGRPVLSYLWSTEKIFNGPKKWHLCLSVCIGLPIKVSSALWCKIRHKLYQIAHYKLHKKKCIFNQFHEMPKTIFC